MKDILWENSTYYHVYNKAVTNNLLFKEDVHYYKFLEKIGKYILPFSKIYAYCLMPNHFHLLIQIKEQEEIEKIASFIKCKTQDDMERQISRQFAHCFNGYTQWFNLKTDRKGKLFELPFRRKKVDSDTYLSTLIAYIHLNPVNHGFADDVAEWKYSSYWSHLMSTKTKLEREFMMDWFNGKQNYINFHKEFKIPYTLLESSTLLEW
ncbi:MAG: transposase [Chitinophagales bacterium]|nr:transposase [Bacteroidota bacterium]